MLIYNRKVQDAAYFKVFPLLFFRLQCSVIAKNYSYVVCGFEKSMYIWRSKNIPNNDFLSTKHMEFTKRSAFVPRNERYL